MLRYRELIAISLISCAHGQKNVYIENEDYLDIMSEDDLEDLPESQSLDEENEPEE